uniref:Uncharacterized protein n=1 Tax=Oryza glumipatula TaxID=40148 RepID=A0A0E0AEF3_9ORYZ
MTSNASASRESAAGDPPTSQRRRTPAAGSFVPGGAGRRERERGISPWLRVDTIREEADSGRIGGGLRASSVATPKSRDSIEATLPNSLKSPIRNPPIGRVRHAKRIKENIGVSTSEAAFS